MSIVIFLLVSENSANVATQRGTMNTFPESDLPWPRGASPLRHFQQISDTPEWALPGLCDFPKLVSLLEMLEGTIPQLCHWLIHFLQFWFTNKKCNCYILISKMVTGPLNHFPSLVLACLLLARLSREGGTVSYLSPVYRLRKGHINTKLWVTWCISEQSLYYKTAPSAPWSQPSSPPQQGPSSAEHSDHAYTEWQAGGEGRWRALMGERNCWLSRKVLKNRRT